jgi:cell division septation protein DedD
MQFLKKIYEKILLGVVVLAALGVVAFLPIMVSQEKQKLDDLESKVIPHNPKALPDLNLSREDTFLNRSKGTVALDLTRPHKIFNPVRFQLKPDRTLLRNPAGTEFEKLAVTNISPLYEIYSLPGVSVSSGMPTRYGIGIRHEAAALVSQRNMKIPYATLNQTTNNFTVISAEGPEEDPTEIKLRLTDSGQTVTITKDKPFRRVEGYTADLLYTPENRPFPNRRKTDSSSICFAGECYKIVDIEESQVVLYQLSNQKNWTRPLSQTNSIAPASQPQPNPQ